MASISALDRVGVFSKGLEAIETGVPNGGDVILGDLTLPSASRRSITAVPLVKEGVVMGNQLQIALVELIALFQVYTNTLSSGGSTPGFGGPNPVLAAANVALTASLTQWMAKYTAPLPPRAQPFFTSNSVFVTK